MANVMNSFLLIFIHIGQFTMRIANHINSHKNGGLFLAG